MTWPPIHNQEQMRDLTDDALVERARHDSLQFGAIFDRYWQPVLRYCFYRLGDWHDAEDAAAQVFLNALSALPRFTHSGQTHGFKAWLFTIAFRVVSNHRRSVARHPASQLDVAAEHCAPDAPLDAEVIAREEHELLYELIAQLKSEQRRLIELRLAGLSDIEIAQVLQKSPAAIRKAQSRAVHALRALLDARQQVGGRNENV